MGRKSQTPVQRGDKISIFIERIIVKGAMMILRVIMREVMMIFRVIMRGVMMILRVTMIISAPRCWKRAAYGAMGLGCQELPTFYI